MLYLTQFLHDDDDITIAPSNVSTSTAGLYKAHALSALLQKEDVVGALLHLNTTTTITNYGATQFFCYGRCRHYQ